MMGEPWVRKLVLTAHVAASVGWLGAVAAFLSLAVVALNTTEPDLIRGTYLGMPLEGRYVLVPLSLASLGSGLLQSLISPWGLLRHHWVVIKLVINVTATTILLLYMGTLTALAQTAAAAQSAQELLAIRNPSPVLHAGAAAVVLTVATILSVFKPRGVTRYGQRKLQQRRAAGVV